MHGGHFVAESFGARDVVGMYGEMDNVVGHFVLQVSKGHGCRMESETQKGPLPSGKRPLMLRTEAATRVRLLLLASGLTFCRCRFVGWRFVGRR